VDLLQHPPEAALGHRRQVLEAWAPIDGHVIACGVIPGLEILQTAM